MKIPAEPKPEDIIAIVDTREQKPLCLDPLQTRRGTLDAGDYSVLGMEPVIAAERKSLSDLLGCIGTERERFEREIQRLLAYECRAIVVESSWAELELGAWRSRVTPAAAVASCMSWISRGIPVVMAGDHERAGRFVSRMLFLTARRRWREARSLLLAHEGKESHV